jgi:hypothetical protein
LLVQDILGGEVEYTTTRDPHNFLDLPLLELALDANCEVRDGGRVPLEIDIKYVLKNRTPKGK